MTHHPLPRRKTKIVATIGPATSSEETIRTLIQNGMNVARLNFSHGTHENHSKILKIIRAESAKLRKYVAVLQDLCGPKVRIGKITNDEIHLEAGKSIFLQYSQDKEGSTSELTIAAFDPVKVMRPGEKALLADGRIVLIAEEVVPEKGLRCYIRSGGLLRSRSGIAVPESKLDLPCLTEKDLKDLDWGVENKVDFVALSFVSTARDVIQLQEEMKARGRIIPIVAKIERAGSLDHIEDIVDTADAVMVARGDLGLELPLEVVPGAQRLIIETANSRGTPVITATQMLQSMVTEVRPTRAEVTDVYSAVREGTDAVMLSEETAVGEYPAQAVHTLDKILLQSEKELQILRERVQISNSITSSDIVADAVCFAAVNAAEKVHSRAIIAFTYTGRTARLISKYRPEQIIFGVSSNEETLPRLALVWGIEPVALKETENASTEKELLEALTTIRDAFGLKPGSRIVFTAGRRAQQTGSTSLMEIREIPRGTK